MFYANSCSFAQHLRQECTTNFTQGLWLPPLQDQVLAEILYKNVI
jgi:hypothetical protein